MKISMGLGVLLLGLLACGEASPAAENLSGTGSAPEAAAGGSSPESPSTAPVAAPDEATPGGADSSEPTDEGAAGGGESPVDPRLSLWQSLLERHQEAGGLRYEGLAKDREDLDSYLEAVAEAEISSWSREEKIAFWINAYNALVAHGVVERYPGLESVIKVDGFFDREMHRVAGEELTLNELERKALDLREPRVHFAVVCASTGCPDLLDLPYDPETLEAQLTAQTAAFLTDTSKGLRFEADSATLWLSTIFDWYEEDFGDDVVEWILPRLPQDLAEGIRSASPEIKFIEYDWSPNDRS